MNGRSRQGQSRLSYLQMNYFDERRMRITLIDGRDSQGAEEGERRSGGRAEGGKLMETPADQDE